MAFSEYWAITFANSFLLSSLSFGMGNLIIFPSIWGLIPNFESIIPFSTVLSKLTEDKNIGSSSEDIYNTVNTTI